MDGSSSVQYIINQDDLFSFYQEIQLSTTCLQGFFSGSKIIPVKSNVQFTVFYVGNFENRKQALVNSLPHKTLNGVIGAGYGVIIDGDHLVTRTNPARIYRRASSGSDQWVLVKTIDSLPGVTTGWGMPSWMGQIGFAGYEANSKAQEVERKQED